MSIELIATLREDQGKGASRRLRHAKQLPAIIYGGDKDPLMISLLQKDVHYQLMNEEFYSQVLTLNVDGASEEVLIRDVQHHPYKIDVMHMDFIRVDANRLVHVFSQLHYIGEDESPGIKNEGGVVNHVVVEVELECLPGNIPSHIEVDLSEMHVGDVIHLTDLKLPEGVSVLALKQGDEHDTAVVGMHVRKVAAEVEEGAPETPEAPESETGGDDTE